MRRKRRVEIETGGESTFELDLSPMLALMVTLIPIMLLSTVFVKVTVIETALPQVVQKAIEEDRSKKDRDISIKLSMNEQSGFQLVVEENGKSVKSMSLPQKGNEWDLEGLQLKLVEVKQMHPQIFRLDLKPGKQVKYSDIVKVMDEARRIKNEKSKVNIFDKETNNQVATDVLFPDVIFSDVVEG